MSVHVHALPLACATLQATDVQLYCVLCWNVSEKLPSEYVFWEVPAYGPHCAVGSVIGVPSSFTIGIASMEQSSGPAAMLHPWRSRAPVGRER